MQLILSDEGVAGLMLHLVNETAHPIAAVVMLECLRHGRIGVMRAEKQVTLAPRSTTAIPDVEFWGAFFDTSYAYRFGPPSHDVTIATLRAPEGEPIAEAFHFSLGRAALPPPATIAASLEGCPGGWRLRLKADSFASSVRIEDPAHRPHDDWFHLAPGREKIVRLTVAIRGQLSPAARDRRAAFRRIHLLG